MLILQLLYLQLYMQRQYTTLGPKFYYPNVLSKTHHPSKQLWVLLSENQYLFTLVLSRGVRGSTNQYVDQKN